MNLFGWIRRLTGARSAVDRARDEWRAGWVDAIRRAHDGGHDVATRVDDLRRQLAALTPADPDVEIELEMLDALEQLGSLRGAAATGGLPVLDTHHRVIGAEPCHFTAPASLPADQAQTSGRVLLTPTRAVFVGAGRPSTAAWHAVHEVVRLERDVLLVRADASASAHFRFNTYGDAVACTYVAQRLKSGRRARL